VEVEKDKTTSGEASPIFLASLIKLMGRDKVEMDQDELSARARPWNSYHTAPTYLQAIVTPTSTNEVAAVVTLCHQHGVPVVAFGGGTSLEGQILPDTRGKGCSMRPISLDMNRMKAVRQLNTQDLDVTVEAGLGYLELNDWLAAQDTDLWFPLDPGPGASIGGTRDPHYLSDSLIHPHTPALK
jgi:D-lactate dehydrogenase (cytochrome)